MNKKNGYTKWAYIVTSDICDFFNICDTEPRKIGYPRYIDIIDDDGIEHEFIPIISEKVGWRTNREMLRTYARDFNGLETFLTDENHYSLLRKCLGKHFRHVIKGLGKEFNIDTSKLISKTATPIKD